MIEHKEEIRILEIKKQRNEDERNIRIMLLDDKEKQITELLET